MSIQKTICKLRFQLNFLKLTKYIFSVLSALVILLNLIFFLYARAEGQYSPIRPDELRCEYRFNPLGIDEINPRFSWIVVSNQRNQTQAGYQIMAARSAENLMADRADMWDTGRIKSDQSANIAYSGKILSPKMQYYWKVRVWDKDGEVSHWSEPAMWSMGILKSGDWEAQWVGSESDSSFPYIRKICILEDLPKYAAAYVTSMGYYELYINGEKADDYVLTPGVSDMRKRVLYVTHDITKYLVKGKNCIALWLGRGWYVQHNPKVFGPVLQITHNGPLSMAHIDIALENGAVVQFGTDATWKTHPSHITPVGTGTWGDYGGECYDAGKELPGWNLATLDESDWKPAKVLHPQSLNISAQKVEPDRMQEIVTPAAIKKISRDTFLIDMGRCLTGYFEIRLPIGARGQKVEMEFGDKLLPDLQLQSFRQRDEYIMRGYGEELFRSRFSYHGFRWVKITGLDRSPELDKIRGYLIHSDYQPAAEFECSNELLNNIYQTSIWTFKCLSLGGYVVDCPTRERRGYGGDAQSLLEAAMSNFDLSAFFTKWLDDWEDARDPESGDVPHVAPFFYGGGGPIWSSIIVTLPWQMYCYYGDARILKNWYPAIQRWISFLDSKSANDVLEFYVGMGSNSKDWSFLGDWLPPRTGHSPRERVDYHSTLSFNNCYRLYIIRLAEKIAGILGESEEEDMYRERFQTLSRLIHERFIDDDQISYVNGAQSNLVFPLILDIVPQALRKGIMSNLENDILTKQEGHINTGMYGTYFLLKYLMQQNRNDLLFEMVNKRTYPGWGYMIDTGATTFWEDWEGRYSQIHTTYISIGAWFIQGIGGIQPDEGKPGFKHFFIKPGVAGDLKFARTKYRSIYGTIISDWKRENDQLFLNVLIPANTGATIYMPAINIESVTEGGKSIKDVEGLRVLGMENGRAIVEAGSGNYVFISRLSQ